MTKSEYMNHLQENLKQFDRELQEEILEDYRQHFAEGEKQGKTEEEIIEELGNIQEMIQELSEIAAESGRDNSSHSDSDRINTQDQKSSTYTGSYQAIEIECDMADIELQPSESNKIHVDYRNDGNVIMKRHFSFYQYEKDGIFCVGVKRNQESKSFLERIRVTVNGQKNLIRLKVAVPKGMKRLAFNTSSGDVSICGLEVGEMKGNTSSGNMEMEELKVDRLKLNTSSGDVSINRMEAGTIGGSASSGDLELENLKADKLELNTASGDIAVKAIQVKEAAFSTASGDIAGKGIQADILACETASGDIDIRSKAGVCRCNTASGDVAVNSEGQDRKLDMSTISGDISINLEKSEGLEANVKVRSGDTKVFWDGQRQTGIGKGAFRLGGGSCKLNVSSNSGDVSISAQ